MRQVGDFMYLYSQDGATITVFYTATHSQSVAILTVKLQLLGKLHLVHETHIDNVKYQGKSYPGILYYNNISEQELIEALSVKM